MNNIFDLNNRVDLLKNSINVLNFGQLNVRGFGGMSGGVSRLDIFNGLLLQRDISVCSVCETFLSKSNTPKLPSIFEWFSCDRIGRGGGVGIAVKKDLNAKVVEIPLNLSFEFVCVSFVHSKLLICFMSVYLPQKCMKEIDDFDFLQSLKTSHLAHLSFLEDPHKYLYLNELIQFRQKGVR